MNESPHAQGRSCVASPATDDEPSAKDREWYHEWAVKFRPQDEIAKQFEVSPQSVHEAISRVNRWMSEQIDDAGANRLRQLRALENMVTQALEKWTKNQDAATLNAICKVLSEIRRLQGIDEAQPRDAAETKTESKYEGLERVAGMRRADAIRAQAARLLATVDDEA